MKASPIQLLESSLAKAFVEPVADYDDGGSDVSQVFEEVVLQTYKRIDAFPDFWASEKPPFPGLADRTYRLALGVRTPDDQGQNGPYKFEVMFTAVVACIPERIGELSPAQAAQEYGLTMLYGMIREQVLNLTSRMTYGTRLLPSVSFMGDSRSVPVAKKKLSTRHAAQVKAGST